MPLVTATIGNFITGVSQQPPGMRSSTSVAALTNAWPSVINGLQKRSGSEHIASLGAWGTGSTIGHVIDQDPGYRYLPLVRNGEMRVYSLDGVQQTISFPNGNAYLQAADPADAFRFLTIADTTFILNRNIPVEADEFGEEGSASYTPYGTVSTVGSLPTADLDSVGRVYYVSSTDEYYKGTSTPGTAATYAWFYTGTLQSTRPDTEEIYEGSLPEPTAAGQTAWLWERGDNDSPDHYFEYQSSETSAATPTTYSWKKVSLASLVALNDARKDPTNLGTVYVTNSVANSYYAVYVNGVKKAEFLTKNGTDAANSVESTTVIATGLKTALTTAGYSVTQIGSTLVITNLNADDTLVAWGHNGDKYIKCYRDRIASFSDLPPSELTGRIVCVRGDLKENGDDYYVIFDGDLWTETYGYNQGARLKASTMPHVLVRASDGTWTFKRHVWPARIAGDGNSNIHPSFVGEAISDVCLFAGRMGFVTGTNIILSAAQEYETFYRKTIATLIDSDRLDFSISTNTNDKIRHAVPFNKDILILGDRSQHRFTYNNYVGPKNVQIQFTTSYSVASDVKPVNMGATIYFADDGVAYRYGKIYEYFARPNAQGDDADETTAPVPQMIKSGIRFLTGAPSVNCLIVGTDGAPDSLTVYKYYWAGEKKIQNAFSTWTFPDCTQIHWAAFSQNHLYIVLERSSGLTLEKISLGEDIFDLTEGSHVLLDRLVDKAGLTISYNAGTDRSTITLPYSTTGTINVVSDDGSGQVWQAVTPLNATTVTASGDLTGSEIDVKAGVSFGMEAELSPLFLRFPKGGGELVNMDGRLQLRRLTLMYANTRYFTAEVTLPGRTPHVLTFDKETGHGTLNIPLMGRNLAMTVRIANNSPFACSFTGGEFQGLYSPKATRMRGG